MTDRRVFSHAGEFVLRAVGHEAVLVPIRNRVGDLDSIYVMSPVAMSIWSLIDGTKDVAAIVAAIEDEYEVAPEVAEKDVADLLVTLHEAGLIHAAG